MKKFIVAIAALAMLTGSAYAAEWNFYGSSRVSTFYTSVDPGTGAEDADNLAVGLQGNARIGANVKVSDELSGRFEYGSSYTDAAGTSNPGSVNLRLLYGVWNFGAGTLLIGQDYTPIRLPYSNSVYGSDNTMGGYGELASSRAAQLKLRFGGLQVAVVAPDTSIYDAAAPASPTTEVKLPQFAAKYQFVGDNFTASILGGYSTFKYEDESVSSYILGAGAKGTFGAFTLAAQVHGGVNVGNLSGVSTAGEAASVTESINKGHASYNNANGQVVDTNAMGYSLVAGYTVNDMFGLEVGYGYQDVESDAAGAEKNKVNQYYLSGPITLAPGVFVVPELGVIDNKEDNEKKTTYFGAKWQINF